MTRITAVYGQDSLTLTARGHATGAPAACAGVSALLYALEGWVGERFRPCGDDLLSPPAAKVGKGAAQGKTLSTGFSPETSCPHRPGGGRLPPPATPARPGLARRRDVRGRIP